MSTVALPHNKQAPLYNGPIKEEPSELLSGLQMLAKELSSRLHAATQFVFVEVACPIYHGIKFTALLIVNPSTMGYIDNLAGLSRHTVHTVKPFFSFLRTTSKVLAYTQFTKIGVIPFCVMSLTMEAYAFFFKAEGIRQHFESLLEIIGALGNLADAATTVLSFLADLSIISQSANAFLGPIGAAGNLVGAVYLILDLIGIWKGFQMICTLNNAIKKDNTELDPTDQVSYNDKNEKKDKLDLTTTFQKHSYDVNRHCGLNEEKICETIEIIRKLPIPKEEQDEKLRKMYKSLKYRVIANQFSHALGLLITTVFLVGTVTILFNSSFVPFLFFATGFALLLSQKVGNVVCTCLINRQLKRCCTIL